MPIRSTSMENLFQLVEQAKKNNLHYSPQKVRHLFHANLLKKLREIIDLAKETHSNKELMDIIISADPDFAFHHAFF